MSLFTTIQVYEEDGAIVFKVPSESAPFAVFPKCTVKVRDHRDNGLIFEQSEDGDNIAFVNDVSDILDSTATPYGVTKSAVYTALNSFLCKSQVAGSVTVSGSVTSSNSILESLAELESFDMVPGNNISITYYPGIDTGNPSGNTNNIWTIVYSTGMTIVATKTLSYNLADNVISVITT